MAVNKQLDEQGESARKLYKKIADSSKDYNTRRREQSKTLRDTMTPIWAALASGKVVNGCKDKLSWCRWANPTAKHPQRYFYKLMGERVNSVQSAAKKVVGLHDGLLLSAKGLPGSRNLPATEFEIVNVQKHGVALKPLTPKQDIWVMELRVRPVAAVATQKERIAVAKQFEHRVDPATAGKHARTLCGLPTQSLQTSMAYPVTCKDCASRLDYAEKKSKEIVGEMIKRSAAEKAKAAEA
jgi:hypothetical protein